MKLNTKQKRSIAYNGCKYKTLQHRSKLMKQNLENNV